MNAPAMIGHNNPPSPIAAILEPHAAILSEAENWADGQPVENEGQMAAVDALIKGVKAARKALDTARDAATKPLHEAWKAEVAAWKPTQDDLDRIVSCLVAAVDEFKRKLAAAKAEEERIAREEAWRAKIAAEEAAKVADAATSDIEAQRAAVEAQEAADDAWRHVGDIAADKVKGLRTVTIAEVTDYGACINWIRTNDRQALVDFMDAYAQKAVRAGIRDIAGVTVRTEKQAF